ncbi:hypothetical protein [Spirosoma luteum]|uniref:hypothetical protein n=1 Tax=Spirosoma luteum TaxID=431553 RepID=UPI000363F395|nr:hypothetical protein [Spirosoma luteum]
MAITANPSYTYQGNEAADLTLRPAVDRPALAKYFAIEEGLKGQLWVNFLERVGLISKTDAGCGTGAQTINTKKSGKKFTPVDIKAWEQDCWANVRGTAEEWFLKAGNDKKDLTDTVYGDYMVDLIEQAIYEDLLRMAHFSSSARVSADLTPSITFANGDTKTSTQLLPYFKTFDGLWRNVELGVAATLTPLVAISQNGTGAVQTFPKEAAYPLFAAMFAAASPRLMGQPQASKMLMVTQSIFTAYTEYRESQNLDLAYQIQANGESMPTFRGVPIMVVPEWDEFIGQYFKPSAQSSLAGKFDRPNRALLTVKGNVQLRFDATPVNDSRSTGLEVWTDPMSETWNARQTYAADMKIADDTLVVAAY